MSMSDEQAIRELMATWHRASRAGDLTQVLELMADDAVFLTPGNPPMAGREAFAAGFRQVLGKFRLESTAEIQEIHVAAGWAYCWSHLTLKMIPTGPGAPVNRSGPVLSVLRKQPDGRWVLFRDANMLTVQH
jgi:uncharacterized protein (TIGR02246 family)